MNHDVVDLWEGEAEEVVGAVAGEDGCGVGLGVQDFELGWELGDRVVADGDVDGVGGLQV